MKLSIFDKYPILYLSIFAYAGAAFLIFKSFLIFLLIIPLIKIKKETLLGILFSILAILRVENNHVIMNEKISGNIFIESKNFKKYRALLNTDNIKNKYVNIKYDKNLKINYSYQIEGILNKNNLKILNMQSSYISKINLIRAKFKNSIKKYINKYYTYPSKDFFIATTIGTVNKNIRKMFNNFGLQHVIAISGYHIAIIICFLSIILISVFSPIYSSLLIISIVFTYNILLGNQPSITRASLMSIIAMIAPVLKKQSSPLNNLGLAALILILINPHVIEKFSFMYSFLATMTILMVFPLIKSDNKTINIILLSSCISIFCGLLSLSIFGYFSIIGILYNTFIPLLLGISLISFISISISSLIIPFFNRFHNINDFITGKILSILEQPVYPRYFFHMNIPIWITSIIFIVIFHLLINIHLKKHSKMFNYL